MKIVNSLGWQKMNPFDKADFIIDGGKIMPKSDSKKMVESSNKIGFYTRLYRQPRRVACSFYEYKCV